MLFDRDCSLQTIEDYEKAESLFKPLEKVATDFAEQHKLFVEKWYHDGTTTLLREKDNINDLNFQGIRKQINLVFDINKQELLLCATAYRDAGTERKIKNISVINFCLPVNKERFLHYLDIARRVVYSIKQKELLSQDMWQEDARKQSAALKIDYWY